MITHCIFCNEPLTHRLNGGGRIDLLCLNHKGVEVRYMKAPFISSEPEFMFVYYFKYKENGYQAYFLPKYSAGLERSRLIDTNSRQLVLELGFHPDLTPDNLFEKLPTYLTFL